MSTTTAGPDLVSPGGANLATSVFYFLLVPAAILFYAYWKISRKHLNELADKIPGPDGLPIIGLALEFIGSSSGKIYRFFLRPMSKKYIKS